MKTVLLPLGLCLALTLPLGGCAVVEVAGAAAGAALSVGGAVISTGVSVTGKVVGGAIDAVSGDDDDEDDEDARKK